MMVAKYMSGGASPMRTLQQKVEALEKIGAGDLADQALQKLIHLHVQKYARHVAEVQRELAPFERQYGISSAECHQRFMAGELGDSADICSSRRGCNFVTVTASGKHRP
jgi:hypothetical protein